jgi:uncharacterized protein YjbI with pentapeptide repeats
LVLKSKRPDNPQIDLSNADFFTTDWSGVDLSKAEIQNTRFGHMDLKDANLSQITKFDRVYFYRTAWWEVRSISQGLLSYLQARYPCDPKAETGYGPYDKFTQSQCDAELSRLRKAAGL